MKTRISATPNHTGINPVSGMKKPARARPPRTSTSRRESCGRRSIFGVGIRVERRRRFTAHSAISTTSGQPRPSNRRLEPFMFAEA